jgi:hypothetical protein
MLDLREIEWSDLNWTDLAQDRDWWRAHEDGNLPSSSIKYWEVLEWLHNQRLLKKD